MSSFTTQKPRPRQADRLLTQRTNRNRSVPSARSIAARRLMITLTKLALPLLALLLLACIAVWPEIDRLVNQSRVAFRHGLGLVVDSGRMIDPHYRGLDDRGRPYTLTSDWAVQSGPTRIDMNEPKGDLILESGQWLMVQAKEGVYMQHAGQLELTHDVVLYRDDGTVMRSQTASVDVKQGAAASNDKTHAEGPFGVLDAQGFMLTDKGTAIQFQGPAHMILNGGNK